MADNMTKVLIFAATISVILLVLNQLIKQLESVPNKLIPLISIVLGLIVGAVAYPFTDLNLTLRLWAGFFAGASAVGLFELGTKTTQQIKETKDDA